MYPLRATISLFLLYAAAMAVLLDDSVYPDMGLHGGYFMGEMDPFQPDLGEDDDIDDQSGWMVVNEDDITQLLNQIEEAEQREDEEEVKGDNRSSEGVADIYENIATETLTVERGNEWDDTGEIEHAHITVASTSPEFTDFWTTDSVVKKRVEDKEANKLVYTESATESTITTSTASLVPSATANGMRKGTTASLNHVETTMSSVDDFNGMTSDFQ